MKQESVHWSDCAVHNGPAYPAGECDCGATQPWNEDEWRRNNWRCGHGWLRGEQCEICNAVQEPYDQTTLELCNVCGWKTLIPDDGCLNCEREQPAQEPVGSLSVRYFRGSKAMTNTDFDYTGDLLEGDYELYTTPPQRPWVGLTDEEIIKIHDAWTGKNIGFITGLVEAKLKEKNT